LKLHGLEKALTGKKASLPLGLSIVAKNEKVLNRPIQGQKGITSRGRTLAREGAYLLEEEYGRGRLVLFTGTLPESIAEPNSSEWGEIYSLFTKKVRYHLKLNGLPDELVAVTEIQEKRLAATGRYAKHLHLMCVGRNPKSKWMLTTHQWSKLWREAVCNVMGNASDNANWNAATNVKMIRKSAANYLAKYMSKGTKVLEAMKADVPNEIPKRWYGITNTLRDRLKKETKLLTGNEVFEFLNYWQSNDKENLWFIRPVLVPWGDGQEITVGFYGCLKNEAATELREFLSVREGHSLSAYASNLSSIA
jgi:hypothetical protein